MHADADVFAIFHVVANPLDLVSKDVRCCHLNSRRKIDDDWLTLIRTPYIIDRIDNFGGKVQFGPGKTLWRILERPLGFGPFRGVSFDDPGTIHCDIPDACTIEVKNLLALNG